MESMPCCLVALLSGSPVDLLLCCLVALLHCFLDALLLRCPVALFSGCPDALLPLFTGYLVALVAVLSECHSRPCCRVAWF